MLVQTQGLRELEDQFGDVFSVKPGWTHMLQDEIKTPQGVVIR